MPLLRIMSGTTSDSSTSGASAKTCLNRGTRGRRVATRANPRDTALSITLASLSFRVTVSSWTGGAGSSVAARANFSSRADALATIRADAVLLDVALAFEVGGM